MDNGFPSAEWVVRDGANGVGTAPRESFPTPLPSLAVAGLAFVLALALLKARRPAWLLGALLLAVLPGAVLIFAVRADAPLKRGELAANERSAIEAMHKKAPWPATRVRVVREDDDVVFPLGRYAFPSRPTTDAPQVELELLGTSLSLQCTGTEHVVCGVAP